ncbi:hypothetical protein GF312_03975 [Candidatus Poribacteria bacterium]|nr:hypothetical protein [Candidatus Poribacteria bacterium]
MNSEWTYESEWFEKTNVSLKIKDYLVNGGYTITKFNVAKTEKGHDIEAKKDGKKLIIEVKGFPSDKYVRGRNKGKKKPTNPRLQAKHWIAEALFSLIQAKNKKPDAIIAFAFPKFDRYTNLVNSIRDIMKILDLRCFFVSKNGNVEEII